MTNPAGRRPVITLPRPAPVVAPAPTDPYSSKDPYSGRDPYARMAADPYAGGGGRGRKPPDPYAADPYREGDRPERPGGKGNGNGRGKSRVVHFPLLLPPTPRFTSRAPWKGPCFSLLNAVADIGHDVHHAGPGCGWDFTAVKRDRAWNDIANCGEDPDDDLQALADRHGADVADLIEAGDADHLLWPVEAAGHGVDWGELDDAMERLGVYFDPRESRWPAIREELRRLRRDILADPLGALYPDGPDVLDRPLINLHEASATMRVLYQTGFPIRTGSRYELLAECLRDYPQADELLADDLITTCAYEGHPVLPGEMGERHAAVWDMIRGDGGYGALADAGSTVFCVLPEADGFQYVDMGGWWKAVEQQYFCALEMDSMPDEPRREPPEGLTGWRELRIVPCDEDGNEEPLDMRVEP